MEAPLKAREVERKGRMPGKGKEQREGEIKIGGNIVQKQKDQIKQNGPTENDLGRKRRVGGIEVFCLKMRPEALSTMSEGGIRISLQVGSYAILLFTALGFTSVTCHIYNWVLFLLWVHFFILSGVISPFLSSSILGTYQPRAFIFQYHTFCLVILFMGFSRQE